ncbi:peptidase C13 [Pseudomonas sp. LS44]|uniref:C13 family peptidase n=1 Tax=Pseudomonas sp. LS44 TaxID=1357074 RepID=UPI00215AA2FC|nr:C13 family peptidase [Pseudomonas sp. LS44]UVE18458.1 peptidase C13 [Pseudomonas sp. LS44]
MRRLLTPVCLALLLAACGDSESLLPPNAVLPDGGRYRGEVIDGLLQGKGRLDYANGSWYEGQFKDGQLEGPGQWQGPNGERYVGDFHLGLFAGQGMLTYRNGTRYEGDFKQAQMDGEGTLVQGSVRYHGEFKDDQYAGLGKLELDDGSSFEGQFVAGEPAGVGVRTDSDGSRFSGTFSGGQLNGQGSYQNSDGDSYSGHFADDQFNGRGRYLAANGDSWLGQFKDGALNGKGEFRGADGVHYEGDFREWRYHGEGRLQLTDGSAFQGHFAHGNYHGAGSLTQPDGSVQSGSWLAGQRVRDERGRLLSDPLEVGLLQQGKLLDQAVAAIPASTPAVELYSLTLAGDGTQSVFMREADYVSQLLHNRFGAHGQISLANHRDHFNDRPLATRENLTRAIRALAERSGPEDLIFIYLTSHGSREHELSLDQPRLQLADLAADELAALLEPLKSRYKVVVISACFSGGFIPPLKDEKTLVMTAARADRVSFGCSEENDFTYFGRALFADALNETDDLEHAFDSAKKHVAEREKADDFEPSEPQIWAPPAVLKHWQQLRETQARKAMSALSADPAAP